MCRGFGRTFDLMAPMAGPSSWRTTRVCYGPSEKGTRMSDETQTDPANDARSRRWFGKAVLLGAPIVAAGVLLNEQPASANTGDPWLAGGNASAATDTLGTTNTTSLIIVTGGVERMRVDGTDGRVGIGLTTPSANTQLHVRSTTKPFTARIDNSATNGVCVLGNATGPGGRGVTGQAAGTGGSAIAGYGLAPGTNVNGVYGETQTVNGVGVKGIATPAATGGTGVRGESTSGHGVHGVTVTGIGVLGSSTGDAGVYGTSIDNYGVGGDSADNPGVYGLSNTNAGVSGFSNAGVGLRGESGSGPSGVLGTSIANDGVTGTSNNGVGVRGTATTGTGVAGRALIGVQGTSFASNGTGVLGTSGATSEANSLGHGAGVYGENTGGGSAPGIYGTATQFGIIGQANTGILGKGVGGAGPTGVSGTSEYQGVAGTGGYRGVFGEAASVSGAAVWGSSSASYSSGGGLGAGVYGEYTGIGECPAVYGRGYNVGVLGTSVRNGAGIHGKGQTGVLAEGEWTGVYGIGDPTVSFSSGVEGEGTYIGVLGRATSSTGAGVWGRSSAVNAVGLGGEGAGVCGENTGGGIAAGVFGKANSHGVVGRTTSATGWGVWGDSTTTSGTGVVGITGTGIGVRGVAGAGGTAGRFEGNVTVTGVLSKGSGTFKIDHPQDPANRYLVHSFVESPEMMNVYAGVTFCDANGEATVEMPSYFEALNRTFRYQLTCIGAHAPVYIADEIAEGRFRIAGATAGLKVSWQVTGVRQDAFAEANPIVVEPEKAEEDRGMFLHPNLFGFDDTRRIGTQQLITP
jgi:hypothetical protein